MNEIYVFISEHIPTIISYTLTLLAYIFVGLLRTKFTKTKTSLSVLFKESTDTINVAQAKLETAIQEKLDAALLKCDEAEKELENARKSYEDRIVRLEKTLTQLLGGDKK